MPEHYGDVQLALGPIAIVGVDADTTGYDLIAATHSDKCDAHMRPFGNH